MLTQVFHQGSGGHGEVMGFKNGYFQAWKTPEKK